MEGDQHAQKKKLGSGPSTATLTYIHIAQVVSGLQIAPSAPCR
jgi:hypothetical protein